MSLIHRCMVESLEPEWLDWTCPLCCQIVEESRLRLSPLLQMLQLILRYVLCLEKHINTWFGCMTYSRVIAQLKHFLASRREFTWWIKDTIFISTMWGHALVLLIFVWRGKHFLLGELIGEIDGAQALSEPILRQRLNSQFLRLIVWDHSIIGILGGTWRYLLLF